LKASIRPSEALSTTTVQPLQHVNISKDVAEARLAGHAGTKSDSNANSLQIIQDHQGKLTATNEMPLATI
jgi:hypothetical protein